MKLATRIAGADQSVNPPSYRPSARLSRLPEYVFVRLDELKRQARLKGVDLIDLGLGNPDGATPAPVIEALDEALADPANHGYPPFSGRPDFKEAVARWMLSRYQVTLEPESEVLALVGSKEGLAHLALAFLDDGDVALAPSPCYPVHYRAALLAGADVVDMPLTEDNGFLPDFDKIPETAAARAKLLILNYPNNPTAAMAPDRLFESALAFCRKHRILLVHDLAYGELYFGGERPKSILSFPGAIDVAVEFHTLSKTFNMAGWRLGFAVGNRDVLKSLYALKTNMDYGVFGAIQKAGIAALDLPESTIQDIRDNYRQRRDVIREGLDRIGWANRPPQSTMYYWLKVPDSLGMTSWEFAESLLMNAGVVVTPGSAFGRSGEGYVRISMVVGVSRLQEAVERIRQFSAER